MQDRVHNRIIEVGSWKDLTRLDERLEVVDQ